MDFTLLDLVKLEAVAKISHKWSNSYAEFIFEDSFKINYQTESGRVNYTYIFGGVNGNDPSKQIEMTETRTVSMSTLRERFKSFQQCICGSVVDTNCGFKKNKYLMY